MVCPEGWTVYEVEGKSPRIFSLLKGGEANTRITEYAVKPFGKVKTKRRRRL
jgi:hypothetical protein